ncbi:dihydroneopterin aldolase, partial [Lichenihabitans sp. Uapishka_5]|uniref:dihydroneopterin aldolase n=1 Tax=Lichenihabitans sp. Uapishka_5 TaxID=3037302 RepID=UPI0029E7FB39
VVDGGAGPGRLLAGTAIASLEAQRRQARALGLGLAYSGTMEAPDVPRLLAFAPDALVFGDLLRQDGGAAGTIIPERVRTARALVADATVVPGSDPGAAATVPDRIFLRDWVVSIPLGAYRHERAPQRVRFTVEAEVARVSDRAADMRHVVTYDLITDAIARATIAHVALVETIAEDVASMILAHPRVAGVDVTVEKLDLGPGSLGCRILRRCAG